MAKFGLYPGAALTEDARRPMFAGVHPESVIRAKRDGRPVSSEDLAAFIEGALDGRVTEGQTTAFLMAVWFRGMTEDERTALTQALLASGGRLEWGDDAPPRVDKHSTGGVGDKVSLCLAPLVACCGVYVPMVSGRGLGHTGGTLDKLSAIPGFRSDRSLAEIRRLTERHGFALAGQSDEMCPGDRRLYALRDVTATVDSVPLIVASICSKKLAEGLDALVLDVKVGSGAFMKTRADAQRLADGLVQTGAACGLRTSALLTDMDQPLGRAVGNRSELWEALDVLEGGGPEDLQELTWALGVEMLRVSGVEGDERRARAALLEARDSGRAYEALDRLVAAQGGDLKAARVGRSGTVHEVRADRSGCVVAIDGEQVGRAAMALGAGRSRPEDDIDVEVSVWLELKRGASVRAGEVLARVQGRTASEAEAAVRAVANAYTIGDEAPADVPLVLGRCGE